MVQSIPDADRVRVYEPDPAMPSGALPMFGGYLDRIGKKAANQTAVDVFFVLGGVALLSTGSGFAAPLSLIVMFGFFAGFWIYFRATYVPAKQLKRVPFRQLDVGADELVAAGKTVGVRLPDGRWLHFRPTKAWRLVLALRRRLWLLRAGDLVFVGLPGALQVRRARIRDEPPSGAVPLPPVVPRSTSPRLDPVLAAHRRRLGRAKPVPADSWTELRAFLAGPVQLFGLGIARLDGRTVLADGREVAFRLSRVDVSLAVNIVATGQLWIAGEPRLGKTLKAGVPGYPLLGSVRLG